MSEPKAAATGARALPQLAWQVSAVPAQLVGLHGAERRGLPFLAAVTGTAALGVVDWPVALLIAGGYLLTSRAPRQPSPTGPPALRAPDDQVRDEPAPAASALGDAMPAPAEPPVQMRGAEPDLSSPPADAGTPTATPAASPPRQQNPPPPSVPVDQAPLQAAAPSPALPPDQPPAPAPARHQRQPRSARDTPRAPRPSAATAEPWPGYDQMTVPLVVQHLDDRDVDLAAVERYEAAHRDRKMVHAAVTSRRASRPT